MLLGRCQETDCPSRDWRWLLDHAPMLVPADIPQGSEEHLRPLVESWLRGWPPIVATGFGSRVDDLRCHAQGSWQDVLQSRT